MRKNPLFPIFFTVFIDLLGVGIVIPVLGHLFLDTGGILPSSYLLQQRTILLGLLISSYPLAQFFGSPILGALSDRYGRKKVLFLSLIGTMIGYTLFAHSIMTKNLFMLFLSRLLDGFTGGNISTAMSAIADVSKKEDKAKNFGLIGMAFGLGFILGPYIGGKLADPSVISWFNHATPFWFAAILSFANIIVVTLFFDETLKEKTRTNISLATGFRNIGKAMEMKSLRTIFIVIFLLSFGFNFFTQFFQVYLIETFDFTQSQIGDTFAYMGIWIALTQGAITRMLSKIFSPEKILSFSIFFLAAAVPILLFINAPYMLLFILPFIAVFNGITYPNATAIISNLSGKESQGEILGINQSVQSLAQSLPAIISGFLIAVNKSLPILTAGIMIFCAWLIFRIFFREERKIFHEV